MTSTSCRRDLLLLAAAGLAAAPALALTSTRTLAYQVNLEHALSALGEAMEALRAATPPNIEAAVHFIQIAMGEVETYASQHGGD
jgi:hypothetical protein